MDVLMPAQAVSTLSVTAMNIQLQIFFMVMTPDWFQRIDLKRFNCEGEPDTRTPLQSARSMRLKNLGIISNAYSFCLGAGEFALLDTDQPSYW